MNNKDAATGCKNIRYKRLVSLKLMIGAGILSLLFFSSCKTNRNQKTCYAPVIESDVNSENNNE